MTAQAQWVTAQYVNAPSRNPKFGSIKTPEMGYISVPAERLGEFRKGGRYCVEIDTTPKGFHNFVRFAGQQPSGGGQTGRPYPQRPQTQRAPQQPQPQRRQAPPTQPTLPLASDPQARTIFITGVVGRAMGGGTFTSLDILPLTMAAAQAWDQVILGIQPPQFTADEAFDDDLPPVEMYDPQQNNTSLQEDEIPY